MTKKSAARKKKVTRKQKAAGRKTRKPRSKPAARKKTTRSSKRSRPKRTTRPSRRSRLVTFDTPAVGRRGLGAGAAGQSGDTQGLSNAEDVDSESVEALVEEGQSFEAGVLAGVEDADASQSEVRTKQVREDDVPGEYRDKD